jgi:hypothetical protein
MKRQTRNQGCPGKNCPTRMGKVKLRNTHWRETRHVTGYNFETGLPVFSPWRSEPVIVLRPIRRKRREAAAAAAAA